MNYLLSFLLATTIMLGTTLPRATFAPDAAVRTTIKGDTAFYKEIETKLTAHAARASHEKLYLHLDRTFFKPGESVWIAAYLRNANDLLPATNSQVLHVQLLDPRGSVAQEKLYQIKDGCAAGDFELSSGLAGGIYKIKAFSNWMLNGDVPFEREITLQKVVLPRLNFKMEYERKAYGAGDEAVARIDVNSLDNKALQNKKIYYTLSIDGASVTTGSAQTDAFGRAYVHAKLPPQLSSPDALLVVNTEYNGQNESISRAVPVVLEKIDLQFFPEGGDAVSGLPTRMAFKALDVHGKPADVSGTIIDENNAKIADFESYHDGMGAFDMVGTADHTYYAQLEKPFHAKEKIKLPSLLKTGISLRILENTDKYVKLKVFATKQQKVHLAATYRDKIFHFQSLEAQNEGIEVIVPTTSLTAGIVRFTLFNAEKKELCERLSFVQADNGLQINIRTNKEKYLPREKVQMDITVQDAKGRPVVGNFSLAVADENLLSFADDKQGHILASMLLEQDVKGEIYEPNFYFDNSEPKSSQALDYLLMTQGYRRFIWKDVMKDEPMVAKNTCEWIDKNGMIRQTKHHPLNGMGMISGKVTDNTLEPSVGAAVSLTPNPKTGVLTDADGNFALNLTPGTYDLLFSYIGYSSTTIKQVVVTADKETSIDVILEQNDVLLEDVVVMALGNTVKRGRNRPKAATAAPAPVMAEQAMLLTSDDIKNMPTKTLAAIVPNTAGLTVVDGGEINIKGERTNATKMYIDGVRVAMDNEVNKNILDKDVKAGTPADQSGDVRFEMQDDDELQFAKKREEQKTVTTEAMRKQKAYHGIKKDLSTNNRVQIARAFYVPRYGSSDAKIAAKDYRTTIYWNPSIITDKMGKAEVIFYASDAVTGFRATVEGTGNQGVVGRKEAKFFTQKPVNIQIKTPHSVVQGDLLQLQLVVENKMPFAIASQLQISVPQHFAAVQSVPNSIQIAANSFATIVLPFRIGRDTAYQEQLIVKVSVPEHFEETFEATIRTTEKGYPVRQILSGRNTQQRFTVPMYAPVSGSVTAQLTAFPSALNEVLKGMEQMLRQPGGCFEQVSSTNYPNLLVINLLRQSGNAQPDVESRAKGYLKSGYEQLANYECKQGGFDWWGRDPAHEGLTAYGIMEFVDMQEVYPVNQKLIDRSVEWLHSRRDGKGSWNRKEDWHGWNSTGVLDAYIAWALAEAGKTKGFEREINHAYELAVQSGDNYQLALLANTMLLMQDDRAPQLLATLLKTQAEDGSWSGKSHSVMHSQGSGFTIETTGLVALALMKANRRGIPLTKAIAFISASKNSYGYGNTQSTVIALKTLVNYLKYSSGADPNGTLVVSIDDRKVATEHYSTTLGKPIEIKGLEQYITTKNPKIEVYFEGVKEAIPFEIEIKYESALPPNGTNSPFTFTSNVQTTQARVGDNVRMNVEMTNTDDKALASPMIVVSIPAGLSLQPWQLKKMSDEKQFDFYELWDGKAVFHFEKMDPKQRKTLLLDLKAEIPGTFEVPASYAYLYYNNEKKMWSAPSQVVIIE